MLTKMAVRFLVVVMFMSVSQASLADIKTGKVIEWGWGTPEPAWIREHIQEMQKIPFDGLVLDLPKNKADKGGTSDRFSWNVWGETVLQADDFSQSIDTLKNTKLGRLTDNFLRFNVKPGEIDWFDDNFSGVISNAGLAAKIAKDCGLKGILFDTEHYGADPFRYLSQKGKSQHTFAEYQKQARLRGRQFIAALQQEYPDITVLLTYGYYIAHARPKEKLEKTGYGLLPSFLDGMLDSISGSAMIYDGWEQSYGYHSEKLFQEANDIMRNRALKWTQNPKQYKKHYRTSFGLWVDNNNLWQPKDFLKNYYTPEEFTYSLHLALKHTDRYVWIYSQLTRWWDGKVPSPYIKALADARRSDLKAPPSRTWKDGRPVAVRTARTLEGFDDKSTFGDLLKDYDEVMNLPWKGWKFKLDPNEKGEKQKLYAPETKDADWKEIEIAEWWEPQGYSYDGAAWYRRWIDIPASAAGKKLILSVGAVDEAAWVYINGKFVGEHDAGAYGWDERFEFDVSKHIKAGQKNLFAIKAVDTGQFGGIWKSIKLLTPKAK